MGERIRGITIEIGGDVTGLNRALQGVDRQLGGTQRQLRDVERLLKLDPSNTELLTQRQQLLAQAVGDTRSRLDTLRQAERQAQEQFARGEISQEQYRGLQREIVATEQRLAGLERQAAESSVALQRAAAAGRSMQAAGDAISGVGTRLLPVTGAVVGLGAAAVKTAADFDAAMSQVAAVSGATGETLEALRDKAREMGAKTKFSATEAAEAMNYMAMAGWKSEDMLSGIEGIMNLAAASGADLATVSDIVTDALTAFGLTAADSAHFADILAAASSNANTNVEMMGETFKYCAPIAGALGFTAEDTALAIGLMANAGIKASQAGTSLRTIMTSLTGEIHICGAGIGDVVIATTNADGTMRSFRDIILDCRGAFAGLSESEKAAAAESLVGKNAMSGFLAIMNAAPEDVDKLTGAIDTCDGAAAEMAATMQDNLTGQITILKSQLQELAIAFGEILMPAIKKAVSILQALIDKLNNMDEETKRTVAAVGLVTAAIGPLLVILGKVVTAVGTVLVLGPKIAALIQTVTTGFALFSGAAVTGTAAAQGFAAALTFITGPAGLIIAAIVGIIAAVVLLWNNCEAFRNGVLTAWEAIKGAFQVFLGWLQETFAPLWSAVVESLGVLFAAFGEAVAVGIETVTELFTLFGDFLQEGFGVTWQDVFAVLMMVLETFGAVVQAYVKVTADLLQGLVNFLSTVFLAAWKAGLSDALQFLQAFSQSVLQIIQGVKTLLQGLNDFITGVFTGNWKQAWQGVQEIFRGIFGTLSGIVRSALNGIIYLLNRAIGAINFFINGLNEAIEIANFLGAGIPKVARLQEIAYLAKGGILEAGSAIVGERGPELLTMLNGKARVTPLQDGADRSGPAAAAAAAGFQQTLNFYTAAMTPSEVARQTRNAARMLFAGVRR